MTQPQRPAWDADYHQMTRHEYDHLLQQRRWQLDADHTAGELTDHEHAYLRDHVAVLAPQSLREEVTHWTPTGPAEHIASGGLAAGTHAAALGEAAPLPHEIADRARQLYATGRYPDYTRAHHAAGRQATAEAYRRAGLTADWLGPDAPPPADLPHTTPDQAAQAAGNRRRHVEDQVLAAADELHPDDDSLPARQLRQTAASIHDHRTSPANAPTAAHDEPDDIHDLDAWLRMPPPHSSHHQHDSGAEFDAQQEVNNPYPRETPAEADARLHAELYIDQQQERESAGRDQRRQHAERSAEALDRVVADMREALDGRQQMPPFRPSDQASDAERRIGWVSDHAHPDRDSGREPASGPQLAGQATAATARIHTVLDRLAARTPARQRLADTQPPAAGHADQIRAEAATDE